MPLIIVLLRVGVTLETGSQDNSQEWVSKILTIEGQRIITTKKEIKVLI